MILPRFVAALFVVTFMGCDDSGPREATLAVENGWMRPPLVAGRPAAGYFDLVNRSDAVRIVMGATITAPREARVEMHETIQRGARLGMRRIESLEIGPGERIAFEPGGKHLMVFGISEETTYIDFELDMRDGFNVRGTLPARRDSP